MILFIYNRSPATMCKFFFSSKSISNEFIFKSQKKAYYYDTYGGAVPQYVSPTPVVHGIQPAAVVGHGHGASYYPPVASAVYPATVGYAPIMNNNFYDYHHGHHGLGHAIGHAVHDIFDFGHHSGGHHFGGHHDFGHHDFGHHGGHHFGGHHG